MDDREAPTRVEVELIELDPKRAGRARHRTPERTSAVEPPPTPAGVAPVEGALVETSPPAEAGSSRLLVSCLAVGAVALFLGWVLGRSSADGEVAAPPPTAPATTVERVAPADTLPEATVPPTAAAPSTARVRPTTTTLSEPARFWVESTVELDARLAGETDRIVAIGQFGDLVELDLGAGVIRSLSGSPFGNEGSGPIAGDGWVVQRTESGALVLRDGETEPELVESITRYGSYWQPGTDRFWIVPDFQGDIATEVGLDGEPTGRSIDTHGEWLRFADLAGGLIVGDGAVGSYSATPDGSSRLADGWVVAVTADRLLVEACGDALASCGPRLVDRATAEVTEIPRDPDVEIVDSLMMWGIPTELAGFSPDGRYVLVAAESAEGLGLVGLLDVSSGEVAEISRDFDSFSAAWSASSRFLYVVDSGVVSAIDIESGDRFRVATNEGHSIDSITVRTSTAG